MSNNIIDILLVDNKGFVFNVDGKNILFEHFKNIVLIVVK